MLDFLNEILVFRAVLAHACSSLVVKLLLAHVFDCGTILTAIDCGEVGNAQVASQRGSRTAEFIRCALWLQKLLVKKSPVDFVNSQDS